jgi:hypothetical protein
VAWNSAAGLTMHVTLLAAALPLVLLLLGHGTTLAGAYSTSVTPPFDKQQLQKQVHAAPDCLKAFLFLCFLRFIYFVLKIFLKIIQCLSQPLT